ncbi:hypothetical protein RP20_CCG017683 [Aedes albopictus]|nr:hypothetical protein RP20_CCG017683 [Aedes albopictus]
MFSLARAVYKQSGIYLMDDPLSAVDAHVAKHLFELCIGDKGFLGRQGATRILVTHQVHFLVEADWVIVMNDGKIEAQGPPQELMHNGIDFVQMGESEATSDHDTQLSRQDSCASVTSSRSSVSELDDGEKAEQYDSKKMEQAFEKSSADSLAGSMFLHYSSGAGGLAIAICLIFLFVLTQLIVSFTDYWISFWVSQEELRSFIEAKNESYVLENSSSEPLGTDVCLYVQAGAVAGIFVVGMIRAVNFYRSCARASQNIHDWCFKGFISATKRFFDTNPSGRILNRFSKDMGAMDELLPKSIMDATQTVLTIIHACRCHAGDSDRSTVLPDTDFDTAGDIAVHENDLHEDFAEQSAIGRNHAIPNFYPHCHHLERSPDD